MSKKYFDFDKAWEEREETPLIVKMFGKNWELPGQLPAGIMLDIMRLQAESGPDAELSTAKQVSIMSEMVPKKILDKWLDLGLKMDQFGEVIITLAGIYAGRDPEEAQGEAQAPKDGATQT